MATCGVEVRTMATDAFGARTMVSGVSVVRRTESVASSAAVIALGL